MILGQKSFMGTTRHVKDAGKKGGSFAQERGGIVKITCHQRRSRRVGKICGRGGANGGERIWKSLRTSLSGAAEKKQTDKSHQVRETGPS